MSFEGGLLFGGGFSFEGELRIPLGELWPGGPLIGGPLLLVCGNRPLAVSC